MGGADVTRRLMIALVVLVSTSVALAVSPDVRAQIDPQVRDRVIPAAVQISILVEFDDGSVRQPTHIPVGSGTVISAAGAILTNAHVVDIAAHRAELDRWESASRAQGEDLQVQLVYDRFLISIPDTSGRPTPRYFASLLERDAEQDLAVLQVAEDLTLALVDPTSLDLSFVPLADSDTVQIGDPVDVLGYPASGGDSLTYTTGVISGFNYDDDSETRAWITTDATLSGGSSGGMALNRSGELVGVPTQGSTLDCRPGDTDSDGRITGGDVGCVPVGGSIGQIRPTNRARALLDQLNLATQPQGEADELLTPEEFQAETMRTAMQRGVGFTGHCATSTIYEPGTIVEGQTGGFLRNADGAIGDSPRVFARGTTFEIAGPLIEGGVCDFWPVRVRRVLIFFHNGIPVRHGDVGVISEVDLQVVDRFVAGADGMLFLEPDATSQPIILLGDHEAVQVVEDRGEWLLVQERGGLFGWIESGNLIDVEEQPNARPMTFDEWQAAGYPTTGTLPPYVLPTPISQ